MYFAYPRRERHAKVAQRAQQQRLHSARCILYLSVSAPSPLLCAARCCLLGRVLTQEEYTKSSSSSSSRQMTHQVNNSNNKQQQQHVPSPLLSVMCHISGCFFMSCTPFLWRFFVFSCSSTNAMILPDKINNPLLRLVFLLLPR